jgi:hypothetical protein
MEISTRKFDAWGTRPAVCVLTAALGKRSLAWEILSFTLAIEGGFAWFLSPRFGSRSCWRL